MRNTIVYFGLPIRDEWKRRLEDAGARILQPKGGSALIVSATEEALKVIHGFEEVTAVEPFEPDLRVRFESIQGLGQPVTEEALALAWQKVATASPKAKRRSPVLPGILLASFFTKEDSDNAAKELSESGIEILERPSDTRLVLNITSTSDAKRDLLKIVGQSGLRLLEEETIETQSNDMARLVIGRGIVSSSLVGQLPLTGLGEVIAIADTGLDTGYHPTMHIDFKDRVRAIKSYPLRSSLGPYVTNPGSDNGSADIFTGHGTHVAGSAVGSGAQAKVLGLPRIEGMAPEAELIFQSIEQTPKWTAEAQIRLIEQGQQPQSHGLYGIPRKLASLFQFAYDNGARIHSNSWGTPDKHGEYNSQCEDLDRFVWEHKDFLVVVAAGNEGVQKGDSIEPISVIPPGTAKNCLTVGASENNRAGQFGDTYGMWWPDKFPNKPFKSKGMVDSIEHIVPLSGRGPCGPGERRKPDVVAPGTFVLSTRSSQLPANNFGWGAFPDGKKYYMYLGGTSMATPLVAGGATLVRQFLRQQQGIAGPSAALVKAALIHSANYMDCPNRHAASSRWADNEQGWGRVTLENVLAPAAPLQVIFLEERLGLSTGEKRDYIVTVTDCSVPLRVTLVYTDYFGEDLINNLNLLLFDPIGKYYVGNDFDATGNLDDVNNVEGIVAESQETGEWNIRVVATGVSQGPQDFALVVSGGGLTLNPATEIKL